MVGDVRRTPSGDVYLIPAQSIHSADLPPVVHITHTGQAVMKEAWMVASVSPSLTMPVYGCIGILHSGRSHEPSNVTTSGPATATYASPISSASAAAGAGAEVAPAHPTEGGWCAVVTACKHAGSFLGKHIWQVRLCAHQTSGQWEALGVRDEIRQTA